ncbi:hypothetical protein C8P68_104538, partial [Mucilaginibacter yixingensis]
WSVSSEIRWSLSRGIGGQFAPKSGGQYQRILHSKTQSKEEFPLRGVLKCWCGQHMTAGFSKGKKKYYLYYRCIHHTEKNFSGDKLHEQFEELLCCLSFTKKQVSQLTGITEAYLNGEKSSKQADITTRKKQLNDINEKIEKLENRLMKDEIDGQTYKKWLSKFSHEKSIIQHNLNENQKTGNARKFAELESYMDQLTNLKGIYSISTNDDRQLLIRGVFKHKLTYSGGPFRTPSISSVFVHNSLKAKEKGLLDIEEANHIWESFPSCT